LAIVTPLKVVHFLIWKPVNLFLLLPQGAFSIKEAWKGEKKSLAFDINVNPFGS